MNLVTNSRKSISYVILSILHDLGNFIRPIIMQTIESKIIFKQHLVTKLNSFCCLNAEVMTIALIATQVTMTHKNSISDHMAH
jgi:hypothetical protein